MSSVATLDGWPALPREGVPLAERWEIDRALVELRDGARTRTIPVRQGTCPIVPPSAEVIRRRILTYLARASRPLLAVEICWNGLTSRNHTSAGPGQRPRVYEALRELVHTGEVLALMRSVTDYQGRTSRQPVFWTE